MYLPCAYSNFFSHKGIYRVEKIHTPEESHADAPNILGQAEIEFIKTNDSLVANENWLLFFYPSHAEKSKEDDPQDEKEPTNSDVDTADEDGSDDEQQHDFFSFNSSVCVKDAGTQWYGHCKKTYPSNQSVEIKSNIIFSDTKYHLNISGLHHIQASAQKPIFSFANVILFLYQNQKSYGIPFTFNFFDMKSCYNFETDWGDEKSFTMYKANLVICPPLKTKSVDISHPSIPKQYPRLAQISLYDAHNQDMIGSQELKILFLKEGIVSEMECMCPGTDNVKVRLVLVKVEVY